MESHVSHILMSPFRFLSLRSNGPWYCHHHFKSLGGYVSSLPLIHNMNGICGLFDIFRCFLLKFIFGFH